MILAAHQPCYLPSIDFFCKLVLADVFVVADDYLYTSNHNINRTKIKANNSWSWLTLPVLTKGLSGQLISEVKFNNNTNWQEKHTKTLQVNYTYAPYFEKYIDQVTNILTKSRTHLIDLNLELLFYIIKQLNIRTKIIMCSELGINENANEKLFEMLAKTGCSTYLVEQRLSQFLKKNDFNSCGFELQFNDFTVRQYYQLFEGFIPNLSILDLLFNEGPDAINYITREN